MVPGWDLSSMPIVDHSLGENKGTITCEESWVPWTRASLFSASGKGRGKRETETTSFFLRSGVKRKGQAQGTRTLPVGNKGGSRARSVPSLLPFFVLSSSSCKVAFGHSFVRYFPIFSFPPMSFSISFFLSRWSIHLYPPHSFSNAPFCPSVPVTTPPPPLRATRNAFLCIRSKNITIRLTLACPPVLLLHHG